MDDMIFRDFISQLNSDVSQFMHYWLNKHTKEPDNFPIKLSKEEWVEQFEAFIELKEGQL